MVARRLAERVSKRLFDEIQACSCKQQTGVSLKLMMDFGLFATQKSMLLAAQFLRKELPIRLAHRVVELENLPYGLNLKAPVLEVRDWYIDSFRDIHQFPEIIAAKDELDFTEVLRVVKERHKHVLPKLGLGIQRLKADLGKSVELPEIHDVLDRFYLSRIGIRMLIGQHLALHSKPNVPGTIGLISPKLSPVEVAHSAIVDARKLCVKTYGESAEVKVFGDPCFTFAYVPAHLYLMIFELVKNSLRSVQERFGTNPPAVRIIIADGDEDVTIKISDEGGGIPRSELRKIWTYFYSTAVLPQNQLDASGEDYSMGVMAGYGYGLPVTRLYARYFRGDLQVISMEGYGTDAYLHLNRLANVQEQLA